MHKCYTYRDKKSQTNIRYPDLKVKKNVRFMTNVLTQIAHTERRHMLNVQIQMAHTERWHMTNIQIAHTERLHCPNPNSTYKENTYDKYPNSSYRKMTNVQTQTTYTERWTQCKTNDKCSAITWIKSTLPYSIKFPNHST